MQKAIKYTIIVVLSLIISEKLLLMAYGVNQIPVEAQNYCKTLNEIQKSTERQSLQSLFALGMQVQQKVDSSFDRQTYEKITGLMKGFDAFSYDQGEYEPGIYLNPGYFQQLARQNGTKMDIAFYDLYMKTKPDGLWPSYIVQQTDYSGCKSYGDGKIVDLYQDWNTFKTSYQDLGAYKNFVDTTLSDLEGALTTQNPCVCGDKASYIKELNLFLEKFPDSKLATEVKSLIMKAKNGSLEKENEHRDVFFCLSG